MARGGTLRPRSVAVISASSSLIVRTGARALRTVIEAPPAASAVSSMTVSAAPRR
ncbi:hypothetical protein [Nonomuraea recticatena]|uniref:hypothetical protein n=1 Tax=Nonomuraea recticatena TaxID=46178 RepID=UPI003610EC95